MASTERKDEIEIGELVSVTIGAYQYDAFILTENPNQDLAYEVHFAGYSREYDGLVSKDSVRKYGENPPLRREDPAKPPPEAPIRTRPELTRWSKVSRKRARSPAPREAKWQTSEEYQVLRLLQIEASKIEVPLPDILVLWLCVDEEFICKKHKLMKLPARIDVDLFFSKYIGYRESNGFLSEKEHNDVLGMIFSLKTYFIKHLPSLLYPFELQKYEDVTKNIPYKGYVCKLYSVMHLLRMIAKMHWVLRQEGIEVDRMQGFFMQLTDLTSMMETYEEKLFAREDYIAPPPGYDEEESSDEEG